MIPRTVIETIESAISEGVELRDSAPTVVESIRTVLRVFAPRPTGRFVFKAGEPKAFREYNARMAIWLSRAEEITSKLYPDGGLRRLAAATGSIRYFLQSLSSDDEPVQCSQLPILSRIDEILNELRSIIPVMEVRSLELSREIRAKLTGDELDHAEQLLNIEGQHEEAILRAAGVIASVVLERHLSDLVDKTNPTVQAANQYARNPKTDGMTRYMDWLIGSGVIPPTERKPLENLIHIRNCCGHPPGGNLRAPTREEVTRLIADSRKYVTSLQSP